MVRQQEAEKMTREVLSTSTSHSLSLQAPSLAGGRPHSSALIRVARLRKHHLFLSFPYVCPEPVLAKCSFLYINGCLHAMLCTQFGFTGPFYMDDGSMETPEYNKTGIPTLKTRPQ